MKVMTLKQLDAERVARGEKLGERLPWAKDTDLVHACGRSGGGAIRVNADGTCPKGCHKDRHGVALTDGLAILTIGGGK